jgi:hypothetical protein
MLSVGPFSTGGPGVQEDLDIQIPASSERSHSRNALTKRENTGRYGFQANSR